MHTLEILKEDWTSFLDSFSRQHELWRVSLNLVDPDMEAHAEIKEAPLLRIELSDDHLEIRIRNRDGKDTTQIVRAPSHLWLTETDQGAHKSLQIESAEGIQTILTFRAAVAPELIGGL